MSFVWKDLVPVPGFSLRGWMYKQDPTSVFPKWRKRYFVQEGDKLYWHKSPDHLEHLGVSSLREVVSVELRDPVKTGTELWKIEVKFTTKSLFLRCETEEEMNYWITGLRNCVHFFQEDWSNIDDEDHYEDFSSTNTEFYNDTRDSFSPRNSQLTGTQDSSKWAKSQSNPNFSTQPNNSKFVSYTTTPSLIPEEEKKFREPPLQRNFLKQKLPSWPSLKEEKYSITKIPSFILTGLLNEEIPKLPNTEIRLRPSSSKPHLIRFPSTGLIIQRPSISVFSSPSKTPQNEKTVIPNSEKIKRLEELTEKQAKTINSFLEIIQKGKIQQKKLEKIVSEFEFKKKGFHLLLETKEEQIRKERQLRFEAENEKTREFEEALHEKNEQISKLEIRVKEMEIELLEKKQEEKRKHLAAKENTSKQMDIAQKHKELEAELLKVKRKYFFTLALNIKISKSLFDMDINGLYSRATEQKIPVDQWDNWILQHAHNKDARF